MTQELRFVEDPQYYANKENSHPHQYRPPKTYPSHVSAPPGSYLSDITYKFMKDPLDKHQRKTMRRPRCLLWNTDEKVSSSITQVRSNEKRKGEPIKLIRLR